MAAPVELEITTSNRHAWMGGERGWTFSPGMNRRAGWSLAWPERLRGLSIHRRYYFAVKELRDKKIGKIGKRDLRLEIGELEYDLVKNTCSGRFAQK
jgi:hypothetical protein